MLLDNINHKDKNELNVVEFDDFLQYIFCLNICTKSNYLGTNVLLAATAWCWSPAEVRDVLHWRGGLLRSDCSHSFP